MTSASWLTDADFLKQVYQKTKGLITAVESQECKLLNLAEEFEDVPALGLAGGVQFPIKIYDSKTLSGGNNGGVTQNPYVSGITKKGACAAVEISSFFEINEMLINTGKGEGAFANILTDKIEEGVQTLSKGIQRYMCVSHGTGRLAVVDAATSGVATFVASVNPSYAYGLAALMGRDVVDIYDLDTGGAAQYENVMVLNINKVSGLVTTDTTMTLSAGWGVYGQARYGLGINGLRNLIDNGDTSSTIMGLTRADFPDALNSVCSNVFSGGASVQLTQSMIEPLLNRVKDNGGRIELLYCNPGVRDTFNRANITMRQWQIANGSGPFDQKLGSKGNGVYAYDGKNIAVEDDANCLPFALYGFSKGNLKRYVARPQGWLMHGKNGSMFHMGISTSGAPKTTWTATNVAELNLGIQKPNHAMGIFGLLDTFNGRDTVVV